MFAGAQIVTTKLVPRGQQKQIIDAQDEDKTTQDLVNMTILVPRSKAAIVVETRAEKVERKVLAQERKHERIVEQQKIANHMENLMEKVLHETPLSKKDEDNLRNKIKTIMTKVNKESDKIDVTSLHSSIIEHSSSSRIKSDSVGQSSPSNPHSKSLKTANQRAFLLWYDKNSN
ncbi:unnamed protein product [Rotaria sordida]|uniref:Uncharacterized protein n=1 Tax=Rotaria sordida TaxID=392033 RepID=A0A818JU32_9BILA|nr:unnamed protein product [Rotaria sordida]CAF0889216.1 unnamed protein product [Rotaria sordida]CAF0894121.1 unnamed protein product [Rotaria sordida]CAF3545656.1 unnamed protein product [Rotaria sordida]CAF3609025.1 unnamed protein product [Rotaria sordida]